MTTQKSAPASPHADVNDLTYTDGKRFTQDQVEKLFRSVGWESAAYPERVYKALMGSSTVFNAWDGAAMQIVNRSWPAVASDFVLVCG